MALESGLLSRTFRCDQASFPSTPPQREKIEMMKTTADAKRTMLLHSEAKVEFYKTYLQRYLHILYLAQTITEINIFDVFCGTGIYDNGKKGSPIVAFDAI